MRTQKRKNQPEAIKLLLIGNAKEIAKLHGLSKLSIQPLCDSIGVTKGAFFHHFKNKEALVRCVFESMIFDFSQSINELIDNDPIQYGAFTRAYLEIGISTTQNERMLALWSSAMADQKVSAIWKNWLTRSLESRGELERGEELDIVRFAADGLCMGASMNIHPLEGNGTFQKLREIASASRK